METSDDNLARARAVDPRFNVALEASAGTGKTRVLVDRYINLLRAGVDPSNILAITFTRKAAAEMRERIMATLRAAAAAGDIPPARWRELRDRTADIAVSTIDAFCLSLLREFPLEADLDPAFSIADDTELPRLIDEALDRALRICRSVARDDGNVALAFAQLGERRVRSGLTTLLSRRIVAPAVLAKYLTASGRGGPRYRCRDASRNDVAHRRFRFDAWGLGPVSRNRSSGARLSLAGPGSWPTARLSRGSGTVRRRNRAGRILRAREHFLTQDGDARVRCPYPKTAFASDADWQTHKGLVVSHAEAFLRVSAAFRRDLNLLVSRGIWRMFRVAEAESRRTLDAHAVLDFSNLVLGRLRWPRAGARPANSFLEDGRRAGRDRIGQGQRIPVGQPDAPVRLRLADRGRLGRPVDAVVLLREVDPDQAHGVVGARGQLGLGVRRVGIPEEVGVVLEHGVLADAVDLPLPDGQGSNWLPMVAGKRATTAPFSSITRTEASDLSTRTAAALGSGVRVTPGTRMVSPALSKELPGFRRFKSAGLAWNISASFSSGEAYPRVGSCALSIMSSGMGWNGPATSSSVSVYEATTGLPSSGGGALCWRSYAASARRVLLPPAPSISPGEKCARSSRTCSRRSRGSASVVPVVPVRVDAEAATAFVICARALGTNGPVITATNAKA